jgi:Family of unknown function (DUF5995)
VSLLAASRTTAAPNPTSVSEVISRLREIEASAPRTDGVACFARFYREMTAALRVELAVCFLADAPFVERLDVILASLFFDTLEMSARHAASVPAAWTPLVAERSRRGVAPLQFALAGMNAHVNRDLPLALVAASEELEIELRTGSPQHVDFERISGLLARVEAQVSASFLHRFDRIDDVVATWDVRRAREAAWTNAETLWSLRGDADLRWEFARVLDRMVGFAGRGLLVPADTALSRLARSLSG